MARQRPPWVRAIERTCCFSLRHTNDVLPRVTAPTKDTDDKIVQDAPSIVGVHETSAPRAVIGTRSALPSRAGNGAWRSGPPRRATAPMPAHRKAGDDHRQRVRQLLESNEVGVTSGQARPPRSRPTPGVPDRHLSPDPKAPASVPPNRESSWDNLKS